MLALRLLVVFLLIALNAFFAATEFSLVAVRPTRIRQLVNKGRPRAKVVAELLAEMGRVISGVQVAITLASLALGFIGVLTLAEVFYPLFRWVPGTWGGAAANTAALVIGFLSLTFLQIVLGELVPKAIGLERAERVALTVARPFLWFLRTCSWAISLLDGVAGRVVRVLGLGRALPHGLVRTAEELQILIQQARERGIVPPREERFIQGAMELGQVDVRAVMVPRPDVHALPVTAPFEEVIRLFSTTQRSRLPVYQGTLDHVLGFVHIKDLVWVVAERARAFEASRQPPPFDLRNMLREVLIVPESKSASELLFELRARRAGLAMVVDEFGSIQGLVTLEDILEQLVGEIHDEFDVEHRPLKLPDGAMVFDGAVNVRDLSTQYNIVLPEEPAYETLGGFVLSRLGFLPRGGESFESGGYRFTVLEMSRRRVARVKITSVAQPQPLASKAAP
ncbi:MAG TPA: hemolysin family protein [Candidatus Acidoferrales bacterium]|nr:hemolysin family protein [Candidatus Acidoferrales bacterium]